MKKIIALLMVALMAVSLAACVPTPGDLNDLVNDAINDMENDLNKDNDTNLDIQIGDKDDDDDVDVDVDIDFDDDDNNTQETVSINMSAVSQQVVYDKNNIKVTIEEMTYEEYSGPSLSLLIENNSDKDISISSDSVTVNNIVFPAYLYTDINAGKKSYEDINFYESSLTDLGIKEIGTIEFALTFSEQDTYEDLGESDVIKLVIDEKVSVLPAPKGDKIYSKNGVTVYAEKCTKEDDDYYNYVTRFFAVNESDKYVTLRCEDVSVNGFMVDPYCSISVPAGKMAYTDFYFYQSDLESNKIKEIEEVEFYFHVYDYNTYDTLDDSEVIKLKAN